ncbi:tudor domain-containing protein 15-like, partial [Chironomus tepperi]|uniref:tudor domain-containing protein 15-like n=1 Tax=Chironomus tepperi TaxID=113505 RepID=UPI00391F1ECB
MTTVHDFKIFLRALINSSQRKSSGVTVRDIKKDLFHLECVDVDKFLEENGHTDLLDLIEEWEDFTVNYGLNEPTVRVKCEDHISQMNKRLKQKRGTINSIAEKFNSPRRFRVILGPDPYGFSPESSINVFCGQNLPEYPCKSGFSSTSLDDDSDDLQYLNMIVESKNTNTSDGTAQTKLTNENKELPNKKVTQILTQLKIPRPMNMMPTTSKAISKESVTHSLKRQTPRQKLSIIKNNSPKVPFKLVKNIDQLIPSCKQLDPNVKNIISIAMLDVVNPHRFWFAEYNEYKALNELMKNMNEFYDANRDLLRINDRDLQRGLYVAALFDGIWHRGMIVKKDANFARISYVDFGTADDIRHIDLCYLKQDFLYLPYIARRGVLAFVQP